MNIRLSKTQLDSFSNLLGLLIVITAAAVRFEFLPTREGGFAEAVLIAVLAWLTNKPATASPTTSQVENRNVRENQ